MGNESSKAHTHGLHFSAKTEIDPSKGGKLKKVAAICVEFDGLAFVDKKGNILYRPAYSSISGWGISKNAKKIQFVFEETKKGLWAVTNAKVLQRAILVRLDVFRSTDKFAANTVSDPSKSFPREVILHVRSDGLVVSDATQREKTRIFEFLMLEGWGVTGAHELIIQLRDQTRYRFFTEDANAVVRKLDDVAKMVTRSMTAGGKAVRGSVVEAYHAEDEEVLDITPAVVVENPFGPKVLPQNVALRILDGQGVRILGIGTNKKVTIQFASLERFGNAGDGRISFQLIAAKGGHTITLKVENDEVANAFCNKLSQKLNEMAAGQTGTYNHNAPAIPEGLAQIGKIKSRRLSNSKSEDLKKKAQMAMTGQQMLAGAATPGGGSADDTSNNVEVVDDFVMKGMSGRNADLLNLPEQIVVSVETAGFFSIANGTANRICASWKLDEIAGWQALDESEILIVVPQGKFTFFMEDAEVLATVLEDACLAFTEALAFEQSEKMKANSTYNPLNAPPPPPPAPSAPSLPTPSQPKSILFTIPPKVKAGQIVTVKNANGLGLDLQVQIPPGVTAGQQIKVPLPDVVPASFDAHQKANPKAVKFTVQKGMKAGKLVTIKNPNSDGKDISFTIPKGVKPGDQFEVKIPNESLKTANVSSTFSVKKPINELVLTVPHGFNIKKNDRLQIKYKGKKMFVKIPPGVGPGQKFKCNVPTAAQLKRAKPL